jgi:hypothetical protein
MEELRFFALEEIPENISTPTKPVMDRYIQMRKMQS